MCGIAGFISPQTSASADQLTITLQRMTDRIAHRGPDGDGAWVEPAVGVALGHRRLSIVDLSPTGAQPMHSHNGRYVLVFNGEIYNFKDLRAALDARRVPHWRGTSDTEIILALFEEHGIAATLSLLNGMFAIAVYDQLTKTITLARDRFGEKPLYYGTHNGTFLFGSELKALAAHPAFTRTINRQALALFFRYNYIPAPHSIYTDIFKLQPGQFLAIDCQTGAVSAPSAYWSALDVIRNTEQHAPRAEFAIVDECEELLKNIVASRMMADVPLGAFLSGGIDSSAIVALMQLQSTQRVRSFSIGFENDAFNEGPYAAAITKHLGTDHTELTVTGQDALNVVPLLADIYDEPFADSSQIPTYLVSKLTREHVTVALSGDAGDELFGGYNRYFWGADIWHILQFIPRGLRAAVARGIHAIPPEQWQKLASSLGRGGTMGDKIHKLATALPAATRQDLYHYFLQCWNDNDIVLNQPRSTLDFSAFNSSKNFSAQMMAMDTVNYLPDDIFTKVDRASMAVSLETRAPFCDPELFKFLWSLPLDMRIRGKTGKYLLRQVLYRHVPQPLLDRPKMGFGVPLAEWLRGPLRSWAGDLLNANRLRADGYLNADRIQQKWQEHQSGTRNWAYPLWTAAIWCDWLDKQA